MVRSRRKLLVSLLLTVFCACGADRAEPRGFPESSRDENEDLGDGLASDWDEISDGEGNSPENDADGMPLISWSEDASEGYCESSNGDDCPRHHDS